MWRPSSNGRGRRGASLGQLADGYQGLTSGDLSRIKNYHGCRNEADAKRFLIDRALSALGDQLRPPTRGYGWRLAVPFDSLELTSGERLHRT